MRRPSASTKPETSTALAKACSERRAPAWLLTRAAGIGAEGLDPPHRRAEPLARRRAGPPRGPAGELAGERTGHRAEIGDRRADLEQLDRAERRAAAAEAAVVEQRAKADPLAGEIDMALQRLGLRESARAAGSGRAAAPDAAAAPLVAPRDAGRQQPATPPRQSPPHRRSAAGAEAMVKPQRSK